MEDVQRYSLDIEAVEDIDGDFILFEDFEDSQRKYDQEINDLKGLLTMLLRNSLQEGV